MSQIITKLLILIMLAGCNLISTRDPESPTGPVSGGWQFPREPEIVIANFTSSIGRRSSVDYLKVFATDELGLPAMVFTADPVTSANYPGLFDEWGLTEETAHIQPLLNSSNLPLDSLAYLEFSLNEKDAVRVLGDTAWVSAVYDLKLGHVREAAPRQMTGQAEYRMLRADDGGWYVQRWVDLRISGEPCWSDLKAQF